MNSETIKGYLTYLMYSVALYLKTTLFDLYLYWIELKTTLSQFHEISLPERMSGYVAKYNSFRCHSYKGHIVSLKSKPVLNLFTKNQTSIETLDMLHSNMTRVCQSLFEIYNPRLIYTFNDEIHFVFMYNDDNSGYLFGGNVHKLLTHISGTASYLMTKFNLTTGANPEVTAKFVQFNEDYDSLNFIAWRQSHCFSRAEQVAPFLNVDTIPTWFKYGTFLKKKMFVKYDLDTERNVGYDYTSVYPVDVVFRKQIITFSNYLFDEFVNFDDCYRILVQNKHLIDTD